MDADAHNEKITQNHCNRVIDVWDSLK